MQAIKESGKRPSEMAEEMIVYPQILKNAKIKRENRENFDKDTEIKEKISQTEKLVGSNRLSVSYCKATSAPKSLQRRIRLPKAS